MDIPYVVISGEPIDQAQTRVVVETQLAIVVNGYGGGRLTFVVPNATLQQSIEEKILWKFGEQAPSYGRSQHRLIGNLAKVQAILDREEAKREEKRARAQADLAARVKAEAQQSPAPDASENVQAPVESPPQRETSPVVKEKV